MAGLCDSFQRGISYLRISVTDRCNLRCVYCMPAEGVPLVSHQEILSFEEIHLMVRASVELGIDKIRITGGEPLVRPGIADLVLMLSSVEGVREISMTTNGVLLGSHASRLKDAGLHRVNVSLDTLRQERFKSITRMGELDDALKGIESARAAGLNPVKINVVPMKGVNDDEILDFARMTVESGWHVRFIEFMPVNRNAEFVPSHVLRQQIEAVGALEPYCGLTGNGAARYYRLPGAAGTIGFISHLTEPFCEECNRLRLSSTGVLYPCLFSDEGVDVRTALRSGADLEAIKRLIAAAIASKPRNHEFVAGVGEKVRMSNIGG
jgi:cyclic pyranopterin phosphate synthase